MSDAKHAVLVFDGGTAGITMAASLRGRAPGDLDFAIVEPATSH